MDLYECKWCCSDCVFLLLDVEQMKLSATAVKDTEEVEKHKIISYYIVLAHSDYFQGVKEGMSCYCGMHSPDKYAA